ncbi:MAG: PDZ domain-containing protein, partial [Vulcanimicrobiaceae bacterium]
IDGVPASFQIDTGSSASFILTSPFVDTHKLRDKYPIAGNFVIGRGVGGYSRGDLTRAKRLSIGDFELDDLVLDLSTDTRGAFASHRVDGNIGNDVLQRLNMTLDYSRHVAYLEPNSRTAVPIPANRLGMYVQNDDRAFFDVVDVLPNGPAFDAGIRKGDRITFVDGMPARKVTENAFWHLMLGASGTTHTFTIDHDGQLSDVSVMLRDIV